MTKAGVDGDLPALAEAHPFGRAEARADNGAVSGQVFEALWNAGSLEVARRRHRDPPRRAHSADHVARVAKSTDPHAEIDTLLDQVDVAVVEQQLDLDRGVAPHELADEGRDVQPAEHHRGGDDEAPGGHAMLGLSDALGLVHVGEDAPGALEEAGSGLGQADGAGGALQQPDAEPLLEPRDDASDGRWGHPERAGRRCKAATLDDSDEGGHGVDPIHATIASPAMISCDASGLSSSGSSIILATEAVSPN